ncbi:uncharacterized protein LOC123776533 isoform X3 [Ursus americanus]|uniref:uncharacterized protein LOC123776533 isoform X3 n=1 Tax=Ursus americanus TaxID=9643 RepID=UPI001E67DF34|nr:uncharacterized protein LOC123776533 isoform X3 [Ursus americanus]
MVSWRRRAGPHAALTTSLAVGTLTHLIDEKTEAHRMVEPGGGGDGLRAQRPPERSHVVAVRGGPARVGVPRTTRAQTVLVGPGHRWWSGPPAELTLQRSLRGGGGQSRCARPGAAAGVSRGGGDAVADLPWVGVRAGEGHGCQQRELPDSGQAVRAQHPRGAWPWLRACGKAEQVQAARERRGSAEAGAGSRGLIPGSSAEPDPRAPGQVHMRWSMWLRVGRARGCGCRARGQQPARCPSKLEPSSEGTHSCCLTPWPRWLPQTLGRRDLEEERSVCLSPVDTGPWCPAPPLLSTACTAVKAACPPWGEGQEASNTRNFLKQITMATGQTWAAAASSRGSMLSEQYLGMLVAFSSRLLPHGHNTAATA